MAVIAACLQDAVVPVEDMIFRPGSVHRTRLSGIDRKGDRDGLLSLLTLVATEEQGAARIDLVFAGDKAIRLEVARPDCTLEDYGLPWPTIFRPRHPAAG